MERTHYNCGVHDLESGNVPSEKTSFDGTKLPLVVPDAPNPNGWYKPAYTEIFDIPSEAFPTPKVVPQSSVCIA
jgi:hypothetical protein